MRLTTADLVVLSVLLHERPLHGHELYRLLEERDVRDWALVSRPQVYYSLRKLAENGYVEPVDSKDPALGPERVVYAPTSKAKVGMREALADNKWAEQRPPQPFVTWAVLAADAGAEAVETQIARRRAFLQNEVARETETLADLSQEEGQGAAVASVVVSLVIKQFEAELEMLDDLQDALLGNDGS